MTLERERISSDRSFSIVPVDRPLQLFHARRAIALLVSCRLIALYNFFTGDGRSLFWGGRRSLFGDGRAIAFLGMEG
ncbi:hypothetical protein K4039_23945 [Lyngbya sp. CCAP 1446/10]|uniref:hypothetical protein n=1 Tax=Lyngbya sp. CCAP 1446/10 TaxID=439293 RepID=UPI0022383C8D|nr:hypothetical protein [Lyngbya sp. CCAP 1446/10]MCW6053039.1 hypothetical protein [Lyngbya sp. CCAP 1446/10]